MSYESPDSVGGPGPSNSAGMVRTMQIICAAMMFGVIVFGVIAVAVRRQQAPGAEVEGAVLIAYLAAGFGVLMVVMRSIVPGQVVRTNIQQLVKTRRLEDLQRKDLYPSYQTRMIVACALLESAGFFNLIAYIMAGQLWSIGIVAVLLVLMAMAFPTSDSVENWADDELRQLQMHPPKVS